MERLVAVALGAMVVGLVAFAVVPQRAGVIAQDDRVDELDLEIEMLRHRVWELEQQAGQVGELTCLSGEISGELSITDTGGFYSATLRWVPKTTPSNVNNPLLNRGVGSAMFRDCT